MGNEKVKSSVKTLTQILSDSSQKLLASFFDDDMKAKKEREQLQNKINLAVSQKSFVVLQISESPDPNDPFETLSGKIRTNKTNHNILVLTVEKTKELRMIPVEHIRKISFLHPKDVKENIAE